MQKHSATDFPLWWRIAQYWPVPLLIPFGLTSCVTYGYLAHTLRRKYLWVCAVLYALPAVLGIWYVASCGGRPDFHAFRTELIFNLVLVGWLFSMVQCAFLWKDYLRARRERRRERLRGFAGADLQQGKRGF